MTIHAAVEVIYRSAMECTNCFGVASELGLATIDLPQPRWVGSKYETADLRILIVMLNPGQGDGPQIQQNMRLRELLHRYKCGESSLSDVLEFQREHMRTWGRPQGRFLSFYTTALGLDLESISFMNIALCATRGNIYPRYMLSDCFKTKTSAVSVALRPNIVLLSGSATHGFLKQFSRQLPDARVLPMMHYAHREGAEVEAKELARIREAIRHLSVSNGLS